MGTDDAASRVREWAGAAAGKPDTHPGKAQVLRDYWTGHGHGGPTHHAFEKAIGWGTPGDFDRCVAMLTVKGKMTPDQAKGYCNLRHHEALGFWPAQHAEMEKGHKASLNLGAVDFTRVTAALDQVAAWIAGWDEDGDDYLDVSAAFNPAEPRDPHSGKWTLEGLISKTAKLEVRQRVGHRGADIDRTQTKGYRVRLKSGEVGYYERHQDAAKAAFEQKHFTPGKGVTELKPVPKGEPKSRVSPAKLSQADISKELSSITEQIHDMDAHYTPAQLVDIRREQVLQDLAEGGPVTVSVPSGSEITMSPDTARYLLKQKNASAWNALLHPRQPAGPKGGQFAPGSTGPTPTNQNPVGEGETGQRVRDLQEALVAAGVKGPDGKPLKVDGKAGEKTREAIIAFQKAHGLKPDGLVGPKTTAALRALGSKSKPKPKPKRAVKPKASVDAPAQSVPQLVTIPGVDLMAAGTWELSSGRQTFTRDDIMSAVEASRCPAVGNPVIKLGHIDPRFDGQPAIGRVTNLRPDEAGVKLVGDLAGMPGWLASISASAFPRRSVEGSYNFRCSIGHRHPFVITGLALLGVTPPGVGVLSGLPDIAALYGVSASGDDGERAFTFASDNLQEGELVAVTEEDVRRAYYATGAPSSWWITELHMDPTQLVVTDGDGKIYQVPFTVQGSSVSFGEPRELSGYSDLAASRHGTVVTYASATESRSVSGASNAGWVLRGGKWVYDSDGDGDDDSSPEGDTDNSHWDEEGNQIKAIPPNPVTGKGGKPMPRNSSAAGPSVDNSAWDASKAWANGSNSDDPEAFFRAICAGEKSDGDPKTQAHWALPYKYSPSSPPNKQGVQAALNALAGARGGVQGLKNPSAAKAKLQRIMKQINPDYSAASALAEAWRKRDLITDEVAATAGDDARALAAALDAALGAGADADDDQGEAVTADFYADELLAELGVDASAATPPTLDGDDLSGDYNNSMMTHGSFTGTHTHPHAANGAQGGDATHSHKHTHSGDGDHNHAHAQAGAGNKEGDSEVEFSEAQMASLRASLGLHDEDVDASDIVNAAAKLRAGKVSASKALPPGVITVEQEVWDNTLRKVEAAEKFRERVLRSERDEVIDQAIRDGKFSASRKTHWQRVWDADPEGTREVLAGLTKNVVPVDDLGYGGGSVDDEEFDKEYARLWAPGTFKRD